jgi:hypothetical protein
MEATVMEGGENGVIVSVHENKALVDFEFNRPLMAMLRELPGAAYNKEEEVWEVPFAGGEEAHKVNLVVANMREELSLDVKDRDQVSKDVRTAVIAKMVENGSQVPEPKISDFHERGKRVAGDILAANGRWAAQFTGFGTNDGAGFVTLHRQSELNQPVFKGDDVAITYGDKGLAAVESGLTQAEKLDATLGSMVDGVKVELADGKYKVSFDYNPALSARISRIADTQFNKEEAVWEVGADAKSFVARAVNDMRKEYVADQRDLREMEGAASERLDGAVLKNAFTKDGTRTSGAVMAVNDRYVLQHTGREYFSAHRAAAFQDKPSVGQSVSVLYDKGRAQVQQRDKTQSLDR